jgi:hypothetical protein
MGSSTEVTSVPTTPEALGPAVDTAVGTQQQLLPQQSSFLQQLGQAFMGGNLPGNQAFGQAQNFLNQAGGALGGAQGVGAPIDVQGIIQGLGRGGGGSGGLTGSGLQDTLRFAQGFFDQGAEATQPLFDLTSRQLFGQQRMQAPNIGSTAFQEQGIDLGSRLGAQRQAQLQQLFTQGGAFGQQDLGTRRGLQGELARAGAQKFAARAGLTGQLAGFQNQRDIFNAGLPLEIANILGTLGGQAGQIGAQQQSPFGPLIGTTGSTVGQGLNFGRPFPTDTVVEQNQGIGNTIAGILGVPAGIAAAKFL